ncbi:thiosulfate oxidation carrier complex protein SoxZ [Halovulum dunhuangense]|uniref:Thiosulfate oxidation carrier complex protein SoxZ n=1 Tax=Halovulum dunhuangense TaxID=1505036 RepID=A0A849KUH2_9RHOB|nr:thiosulfate oxidation carrier complex protein SoxZ [Halovulum dunhuangense]NNU79251.1 thiosulfate oxidation carrier complex protein SoxZ [Halovulum dunhuangense]
MATGVKPRVRAPKTATPGEVVVLKTLISHPMESGQRRDSDGNIIPRSIINRFTCTYGGETVIEMELHGAISTNPYIEFEAKVPASGEFVFTWYDDDGDVYEERAEVTVA